MKRLWLVGLAACSHPPAATPSGPVTDVCLAGNCVDGKGAKTFGRGTTRALYVGAFEHGQDSGDAIITRVAGEMIETLAIDAASQTGTIDHAELSVVGEITNFSRNADDGLPELDDDSAAVMLATGEFMFASWSATTVAPRDSNLTEARRIGKLPEVYADLFAGAAVLEEARHTGRTLEIHAPGEDHPAPHHTVATLTVFAPGDTVAYIVGVGVPDPTSPTTKLLRSGATPTGAIPIVQANGKLGTLELRQDAIVRWPSEVASGASWTIAAQQASYATATHALEAALGAARVTREPRELATQLHRAATAAAAAAQAADDALALLPGTEIARHDKLATRARDARTHQAHAELAARIVDATDPARAAGATAMFADAIAAIGGPLASWDP